MNAEQARSLGYPIGDKEKGGIYLQFAFPPWGRKRDGARDGRLFVESKELRQPGAHIIADVLPHQWNDPNPLTIQDTPELMRWANHLEVAGRVYLLESYPDRKAARINLFTDYYQGWKDDEGRDTNPQDSIFHKTKNKQGRMIANSRLRTRGVPFIDYRRHPRTMELERVLAAPEIWGKKVGLGHGIAVLDTALLEYDGYNGLPADEVRASFYVDVDARRNINYFELQGWEPHGPYRKVNNNTRYIQPIRISLERYRKARPRALHHLGHDQSDWAAHLDKRGAELEKRLAERI